MRSPSSTPAGIFTESVFCLFTRAAPWQLGQGAYTLAMGSTYNSVPRPAVVMVKDGEAREIRRREVVDDLLRYESESVG